MRDTSQRAYDAAGLNVGAWPEVRERAVITPAGSFFKRSHATPPDLDPHGWRLEVGGLVQHPQSYKLTDLAARFARRELDATVVCAGLRRAELLALGPIPGELEWGPDAASTGRWSGFGLDDVLRAAGVTDEARHVEFVGLDRVERNGERFGFGGSIDLDKALSDDVLLATHLDGEPLPREHGFPLRVLVPGWIGARSVKWLGRITVQAQPSTNYFQAKAYRVQKEANPADPRDVSAGEAMTEIPLNAIILEPQPDSVVPAGPVRVRGWAIGSGGRPVTAVEVSRSGDLEPVRAELEAGSGRWVWRYWEAVIPLEPGRHTLSARAFDGAGAMPADLAAAWNVKGYGNNACYRVAVTAVSGPMGADRRAPTDGSRRSTHTANG